MSEQSDQSDYEVARQLAVEAQQLAHRESADTRQSIMQYRARWQREDADLYRAARVLARAAQLVKEADGE